MSDSQQDRSNRPTQLTDHRDFPRLDVEAKARIAGVKAEGQEQDAPAVISDLSLGGARMRTPAALESGTRIRLIPFAGLLDDHPLHKELEFEVMWVGGENDGWRDYGLSHQGLVLDILDSWLGHLLLRREKDETVMIQRRKHRRLTFTPDQARPLKARVSHDESTCELNLLDVAPGGLLASSDLDIPIGVHLEFTEGLVSEDGQNAEPLYGSVIDRHSQSGSNFYRVSFDPDSNVDESSLVDWAMRLGGDLDFT